MKNDKVTHIESKVSVIVPVYNAEKSLAKCIESILNQTHTKLEIILINDGSIDDSLEICNYYASADKRIIVIDQENSGVASARNAGLKVATGDYIGFVDSDDYISFDMYEKLNLAIVDAEASIAECGVYRKDASENIIAKYCLKSGIYKGNYECNRQFIEHKNSLNYTCNKLYYSDLIKNIKFKDLHYIEDYLFNIEAYYRCITAVTIKDCLYHYIDNAFGASGRLETSKGIDKTHLDMLKALEMARAFYLDKFPELCKYVDYYALKKITNLYCVLKNTKHFQAKSYFQILSQKYNNHYFNVRFQILEISGSKKEKFKFWLFQQNPLLFCNLLKVNRYLHFRK